jgi:xyloglucan-specific exo-beta-1,4-glucanase
LSFVPLKDFMLDSLLQRCRATLQLKPALIALLTVWFVPTSLFGQYTWKSVRIGGFGAIPDIKCIDPDGSGSGKGIYFITTDVSAFSKWNDNFANPRWYLQMMFMNDALSNDTYGAHIGTSPDGNTLYVSTGKAAYNPNAAAANENRGKLWKSVDGGATWSQPNPNFRLWNAANWDQRRGRNRITVDPRNPNVVYVASREGLHRSLDGGQTWLGGASNLGSPALPGAGGTTIDASDDADPFEVKHSNGCAWVLVDPTSTATNAQGVNRSSIVWCCVVDDFLSSTVDATHPGGIFNNAGVYRSTDGGQTFAKIAGSLDGWSAEIDNFGNVFMVAALDRANTTTVDERGLFRCLKGATSFTRLTAFDQFIVGTNDRWTLGGISIHRNPSSGKTVMAVARHWTFGSGPSTPEIREGNSILVNSDVGVGSWRIISQASIDANTIAASNPASLDGNSYDDPIRDVEFDHADRSGNTLLYAGYLPHRSTNLLSALNAGGSPSWSCITQGHEELVSLGGSVSPVSGTTRFWSSVGDLGGFRHGTNLDVAPPGFRSFGSGPGTVSSLTNCTSIDVSPSDPNVVVLVGRAAHDASGGATDTLRRSFITTNGNAASPNFNSFAYTGLPARAAAGKIAISANATSTVAGTLVWAPQEGGGVWYSTNRGSSWSRAGTSIPNLIDGDSVFADYTVPLAADRQFPNNFYAYNAGNATFYRSTTATPNFVAVASPVQGGGGLPGAARPFVRSIYDATTSNSWVGISLDNNGFYLSKDEGATNTFVKITAVNRAVAFDFGKANAAGVPAIFVWGRVNGVNGIFRSENGGNNWTAINAFQGTIPVMYGNTVNALMVLGDKAVNGRVYVGSNSGFFYGQP